MEPGSVVGWFGLPAGYSPAVLLRRLARAGYIAGPRLLSRSECLFLETQDGRLAKQGFRFSLRGMRNAQAWSLSGPDGESAGPFEGKLVFRSLSSEEPGLPGPVKDLASGALFFPLVRLRVAAWATRLRSPSGSILGFRTERFTAVLPREPWAKSTGPLSLVTVRWLEGDQEALLHLATYLRDRLGLPEAPGDACRVALLALGIPEPGAPIPAHLRIQPEDSLAAAGRKVVGQQLLKMKANMKGTLEDLDPEYLHDLRVATRRLRSALRLLAPVLGPKRCDALRAELGWIGQLLGAVRDLDVFILNLQTQAQRLGEAGGIATLLADELRRHRVPARDALCAALASRPFGALVRRFETLVASPPPRHPRGQQRARVGEAAPVLIRQAQKRVLKLGRSIGPDSPAADLHRLRILFKRLRYTCEFFREAFVDPVSGTGALAEYIQAMVRFQDCLGEHQDAVVAGGRIQALASDMVQRGALSPDQLLNLGGLIQVQREIVRDRRGRLGKLWARFDRRSVRKSLAALETPPMSSGPTAGTPAAVA